MCLIRSFQDGSWHKKWMKQLGINHKFKRNTSLNFFKSNHFQRRQILRRRRERTKTVKTFNLSCKSWLRRVRIVNQLLQMRDCHLGLWCHQGTCFKLQCITYTWHGSLRTGGSPSTLHLKETSSLRSYPRRETRDTSSVYLRESSLKTRWMAALFSLRFTRYLTLPFRQWYPITMIAVLSPL